MCILLTAGIGEKTENDGIFSVHPQHFIIGSIYRYMEEIWYHNLSASFARARAEYSKRTADSIEKNNNKAENICKARAVQPLSVSLSFVRAIAQQQTSIYFSVESRDSNAKQRATLKINRNETAEDF